MLPLQLLKEILEKNGLNKILSISLDYLANGSKSEDLEFINATSPQSNADMFTAWQTNSNQMNTAQYCPQNTPHVQYIVSNFISLTQYIVQPFNITPTRSTVKV